MLQQINTENFQQMLSQFSTTELEGMIEKFPYFQQAHLLLAKKYQQENSPKFDQQLQLAALYIQDRELLHTLFNEKSSARATFTTPTVQEKEIGIKEEKIEIVEPAITALMQEEVLEQIEVNPVEIVEVSAPDDIAIALAEIKQSMDAIQQIADEVKTEEATPLVQLTETSVESARDEMIIVETAAEEKLPIAPEIPQVEKIEATAREIDEEAFETSEPELKMFSRIEPHTFDEWLDAFNNKSATSKTEKKAEQEEEPALIDEELTQLIAENITVDYLHGLVKEETNYAKGLERFIDEQIQKHKQPETRKKAAEYITESELVTETMAKVYEMQKKYSKAINAYEALALKFPEKSSLFAARINYLKNIL